MNIEQLQRHPAQDDFAQRFAVAAHSLRQEPYRANVLPAALLARFVQLQWPRPKNFFLATADGKAIVTLGANVSASFPETGFIGFFECDLSSPDCDAATGELIAQAERFLRQHGVKNILAPVNYNTWFPYRFLKPGCPPPYYAWEPIQPPQYYERFMRAGYHEAVHYTSIAQFQCDTLVENLSPSIERANRAGYGFRAFDSANILDREVPLLYQITMEAFAGSHLFEPLPFEQFRELYVPIAKKMDFSLAYFLLNPAGKEIGFLFSFLDETHKDHFVAKTIALLNSARGEGLSNALLGHACRNALARGATRVIHALMRADAQSHSYAKYAPTDWEHHYVLLEKAPA